MIQTGYLSILHFTDLQQVAVFNNRSKLPQYFNFTDLQLTEAFNNTSNRSILYSPQVFLNNVLGTDSKQFIRSEMSGSLLYCGKTSLATRRS